MMSRSLLLPSAALLGVSILLACGSSSSSDTSSNDPNNQRFGGPDGGGTGRSCSPNPANYDVPGNNCDDDNDGTADNPPSCDDGLSQGGTAEDFARAIGICTTASKDGYGLVSATFTRGYNSTQTPNADQHGVLPKFGNVIKPREGKRLGVLSTGYAQEYNGGSGVPFGGEELLGMSVKHYGKDWGATGRLPPGFPKASLGCQQGNQIHDLVAVKLSVKAPPNANGIKFDFNFFSGEWPAYVCSPFNDGFVAFLSAKGFNDGVPDNMSFDKQNNPVSVNNGFFDRCTPNVPIGCANTLTGQQTAKPGISQCPGGASELEGTGFGIEKKWCAIYSVDSKGTITNPGQTSTSGGATGWLTSQAPVSPGETFTLELILWDTGDGVLDSSILLDNFGWAEGAVSTTTERPR